MRAWSVLVMVLVVAACTSEPAPEPPMPDELLTPEAYEVEEPAPPRPEPEADAPEPVAVFSALNCDPDSRTLSFTLTNPTEKTWLLDPAIEASAFEPTRTGRDPVGVYYNNYKLNLDQPHYLDGELLFGPKETFAENCEGKQWLDPGESASCTFTPVPLRKVTQFASGTNELELRGSGFYNASEFSCPIR